MTRPRTPAKCRKWWIAVVAYRGIVDHVEICMSRSAAVRSVAGYLREHHRYGGPSRLQAVVEWVEQHEPDFHVDIVDQARLPLHQAAADSLLALPNLTKHLASRNDTSFHGERSKRGFVVLTRESDPDTHVHRIEAAVFNGSLQHNWAGPIVIGTGADISAALRSLDRQL